MRRRKDESEEELKARRRAYDRMNNQRPAKKKRQKEYRREYQQRPEVKARRKRYLWEYEQRPEVKEHRKEYRRRTEVKERRKVVIREYKRKRAAIACRIKMLKLMDSQRTNGENKQGNVMALNEDLFTGYCPSVALAMIPSTARVARVARGIYDAAYNVCFLNDRVGTYAASVEDEAALRDWLADNYSKICEHIRNEALSVDSEEFVEYNAGTGHFKATPNRSYGYLYCAFWLE